MRLLLLPPLLLLPACLVGEITDIPCSDDTNCPTNHFCDVPNEVCIIATDLDTAPDLVINTIIDGDGERTSSPFVEPNVSTELRLVVENVGARDANGLSLEMGLVVCTALTVDAGAVPDTVPGLDSVEIPFTVTPDDCGTPVIQDWFLFYSGRAKRGTFNINIARAPASGD